jgi:hypothetical protein
MATLGPDSPRRRGRDAHGVWRELGDIDSDGYLVGWIAPDGSCWQSRCEHEIAIACGRYLDAWLRWNRTGGALGTEPDPARFVARYCSPDCEDEALHDCAEAIELLRLGIAHRARAAQRN